MLTIHVWPERLKEFLLTHPLYKSPSTAKNADADLWLFGGLSRAYESFQHVAAKFARRRKRIDAAAERIPEFAACGEIAVGQGPHPRIGRHESSRPLLLHRHRIPFPRKYVILPVVCECAALLGLFPVTAKRVPMRVQALVAATKSKYLVLFRAARQAPHMRRMHAPAP